jgi:CubicO group peptidase (beta-lactamase class C family)
MLTNIQKECIMKMIFSRHLFKGISLFLLTLWLALIPLSAFAATPHTSTPDFATIDTYVLSQMRSLHIPGVALGIVHGNQVVHLRGFGVADPTGRPVTPQTTFAISSMTKSFTAVAIMQLVEQGKVALDAPVQRYLPWFRVATPGASGRITVRELLNQTSGISHSAGTVVLAGTGDATMEQAVQTLRTVELIAAPGTTFQYSNLNYVILGLIVQVASGQSYETYVQQHIFAPLQMHHSFTLTSQNKTTLNGMATGYRWWFGWPFPFNHRNPPEDLPAGGIITSAEDMTHYLIAQLNGGDYGSTSVLSPASIAVLDHPVVLPSTTTKVYAMGWYALPVDGESILFHSGDDANFHADMALLPQSQWAVVVLRNANSEVPDLTQPYLYSIPAGVIDLLLGQQPHAAGLGLDTIFLIVDAMIFVLSLLALWSTFRLIRRWRQPLKRTSVSLLWGLVLPLLWEVALPIGLFVEIPKLAGVSWAVALLFLPDVGFWMLGMFALLLITGMARSVRIVWPVMRSRRTNRGTSAVPV